MRIEPDDVLIVTDVQNDFCPGGALEVQEGHRVVVPINSMIHMFPHVVYVRDWHPAGHCSFDYPPEFMDGSWPEHCVQDSPGAEFHGDLLVPTDAFIVSKGTYIDKEEYSGFARPELNERLVKWGIKRVFVCGLTTEYCVKQSALDALALKYEVWVVENACRGVNFPPGSAALAINELRDMGVYVCWSGDLETEHARY